MSDQTTHKSELNRLASLTEKAELGGGSKAIKKRHNQGKLTARERLTLLFDPHTFVEMNQLAESQAIDFGMQKKKVPGDHRLWIHRQTPRLRLCPGCHGTGGLGGNRARPENLPHHG